MSASPESGHPPVSLVRSVPLEAHAPQQTASLFNYLVGAREHGRRHGEAEGLSGLEIDQQLELGRLQDG